MAAAPRSIPFDSLCLAAVTAELQAFVGGKLQKAVMPAPNQLVLELYREGLGLFKLDCGAQPAAYFTTVVPEPTRPVPTLAQALKARMAGARLVAAQQVDFDRILRLDFKHADGVFVLIAELIPNRANLILLGQEKILAVAKRTSGTRELSGGATYLLPPRSANGSVLEAAPGEALDGREGASPFLVSLLQKDPSMFARVRQVVESGQFSPVMVEGLGAYPISAAALGLKETAEPSFSLAYERFREIEAPRQLLAASIATLQGQLTKVRDARSAAIRKLEQAQGESKRSREHQIAAELLLAFKASIEDGSEQAEVYDYEGNPLTIALDQGLTVTENAEKLFAKAKHAKERVGANAERLTILRDELLQLEGILARLQAATTQREVEDLQDSARKARWLSQPGTAKAKEERPFEGHRVAQVTGPSGYEIFYGENATSNDYLTMKLAKPNDYWLHVRGAVSAHVLVRTHGKPESVQRPVLEFAARLAALNSPQKHSSLVAVDYTLRKHVRKPRGAAPGFVVYEREKTLNVAPKP
ncbi:MAG: NFACT family protein [Armatimonadetes bacterium]|nr:NFACT family protein [Armatimonadota bacterium]